MGQQHDTRKEPEPLTRKELDALKLRDEVAWYKDGTWYVTVVTRITKTQITTSDGRRWSIAKGNEVGAGIYASWLRAATPEIKQLAADAVEYEALVSRLRNTDWRRWDLATLRRVVTAVEGSED